MNYSLIKEFTKKVWLSDGVEVTAALGFRFPTRCAIIQLSANELFVWSPIKLSDELKKEIETLGEVRHIVSPSSLHHLFMNEWITAFPNATVYGVSKLANKRKDIKFDVLLDNTSHDIFNGELQYVVFEGNLITQEAVFFHSASRTVIFTDLLQDLPQNYYHGWRALIAKIDCMTSGQPAVPLKYRNSTIGRKEFEKSAIQTIEWHPENIIIAHGKCVIGEATDILKQAFSWL